MQIQGFKVQPTPEQAATIQQSLVAQMAAFTAHMGERLTHAIREMRDNQLEENNL